MPFGRAARDLLVAQHAEAEDVHERIARRSFRRNTPRPPMVGMPMQLP